MLTSASDPWRSRCVRRIVGLCVCLAGVTACSSDLGDPSVGALPETLRDDLQQVLDTAAADVGFAGVIAAVRSPDGQWVGTAGTTGRGETDAVTSGHHTRIGSVTKTFTGTALLQLVERGEVSLSDTVEQYVPGLPNGTTATLRDLAQMTSGIPSYSENIDFLYALFGEPERPWTANDLLSYVYGADPLFAPGEAFHYSNTNTVVLGLVIEKVTGRSLGEVFQEQIFDPLGLTGTSWPGLSATLPEPYLRGETRQGLPEDTVKDATDWNPSWANAAGSMISTLDDLLVWGRALGTGEGILEPATQGLRVGSFEENLGIDGNAPDGVYGIGVGLIDGWIGHTGELPGYNTSVLFDPVTGTTAVVMVNSDIDDDGASPAPTVMRALQDVLAGR